MNDTFKKHLISGVITFVSTFLTTFSALIALVPTESLLGAGWGSLIASLTLTAIRGAVKPALESFLK